jgi:hypothetical protein
MTKHITLEQLKERREARWNEFNELIEYKRELLDEGQREKASRLQETIDYVNAQWAELDNLIEELENN